MQGYNVIYKNNMRRKLLAKSVWFATSNPTLLPLGCNETFISAVRAKWKKKAKLSEYYDIFDTFDTSGRIKAFAQEMLVEGKTDITQGIEAVQALIDTGYTVVILTGHTEAQNAEFKKAFPIMADDAIEVVSNYEATSES